MFPSNPCAFSWTNFPLRQNLHVFQGWNFLFLTFCFTACYLKKRNKNTRFNAIYPFQHLFTCFNFALLQYFAYSVQFSFFCMFNFCFSHFVSTTSYFKKRNKRQRFNAILQIQHKFLRSILHFCSFLRISVAVGCLFEAISALKLRCLWWARIFLQKRASLLNVGCLCQYLSDICKHGFCQKHRQTFFGGNFWNVIPLNRKFLQCKRKYFRAIFIFPAKKQSVCYTE